MKSVSDVVKVISRLADRMDLCADSATVGKLLSFASGQ